ncbi:metallophosphoesterase family protein [Viridibacillus arvi]|uniref:metallophosphoesterase family protein n=1 Tax=Viridibacillus arvi TaxID=263475 RepID=UPI00187BA0FC|nr:metallophosphoesterase family protein [Viridibacillus sp. JNUCC-6]QOV12039.1 metallophosphoesterase [Viridibacillus sp. JNUCC-6]
MRVAAIYDIHGNYKALEAVLNEIEKEKVDKVIVGGDLAWGPQPKKVIDKLFAGKEDFIFIMGNSDREIFEQYKNPQRIDNMVGGLNQWCIEQLTTEQLEWLGSFKFSHLEENVLFVHGSPRSDTEAIRFDTPESEVYEMIKNENASVIVCGHTHIQFRRNISSKEVINAGSVGLQSRVKGACWLLINSDEYILRVTEYDFANAAKDILLDGAPYKEEFADHVKNPPYEGP